MTTRYSFRAPGRYFESPSALSFACPPSTRIEGKVGVRIDVRHNASGALGEKVSPEILRKFWGVFFSLGRCRLLKNILAASGMRVAEKSSRAPAVELSLVHRSIWGSWCSVRHYNSECPDACFRAASSPSWSSHLIEAVEDASGRLMNRGDDDHPRVRAETPEQCHDFGS